MKIQNNKTEWGVIWGAGPPLFFLSCQVLPEWIGAAALADVSSLPPKFNHVFFWNWKHNLGWGNITFFFLFRDYLIVVLLTESHKMTETQHQLVFVGLSLWGHAKITAVWYMATKAQNSKSLHVLNYHPHISSGCLCRRQNKSELPNHTLVGAVWCAGSSGSWGHVQAARLALYLTATHQTLYVHVAVSALKHKSKTYRKLDLDYFKVNGLRGRCNDLSKAVIWTCVTSLY